MASQSFLSVEGCHCLNVGFPPDVFILCVVPCRASSPSTHSHLCHLSGVQFFDILFLFFTEPAVIAGFTIVV